ncbi:MAG: S8 family serine peptidase [Candidatus Brocadiae bacterium]|nr:S8 family serine peptidase [Candidatus Brocadiia bacterium]
MPRTLLVLAALTLVPRLSAEEAVEEKMAPPVVAALAQDRPVPVIVLCRSQLLAMPAGFDAFCRENAGGKRSELRREVIAKLKALAANGEQEAVLKAAGAPDGAERLWIVNAVVATLSPAKIRNVAALDAVRYVYAGTERAPAAGPGRVSEVIARGKRGPFSAEGLVVPWNLEKIGAVRVWKERALAGEGVVVAMLDAGTNYAHEDLRGNIWRNPRETPNNGKDDDGNGYVDDLYGYDFETGTCEVRAAGPQQHGTWTAGIVAGDGAGGTVTGVAPRAQLMLLKGMSTRGAALAIQYALEHGADILNMSFSIPGLGNGRGFWRLMSEQAVCAGLVLVSGCGNFQQQQPIPVQIRIPEGIPCVIGAGGLDQDLNVPKFCSLGPVEWASVRFYGDHPHPPGLTKPDVCGFTGPGYPVLAAADKGYIDPNTKIQGNSFSSPHISGVAALMLSAAPELPAWRVREILEATAADVGEKGKDNRTGAGLARAWEAVRGAEEAVK